MHWIFICKPFSSWIFLELFPVCCQVGGSRGAMMQICCNILALALASLSCLQVHQTKRCAHSTTLRLRRGWGGEPRRRLDRIAAAPACRPWWNIIHGSSGCLATCSGSTAKICIWKIIIVIHLRGRRTATKLCSILFLLPAPSRRKAWGDLCFKFLRIFHLHPKHRSPILGQKICRTLSLVFPITQHCPGTSSGGGLSVLKSFVVQISYLDICGKCENIFDEMAHRAKEARDLSLRKAPGVGGFCEKQ